MLDLWTSHMAKSPVRCMFSSPPPGPFEEFSISEDIYATFYLLARNATPDMYSISPFKNPDVSWMRSAKSSEATKRGAGWDELTAIALRQEALWDKFMAGHATNSILRGLNVAEVLVWKLMAI